MTVRKSVWLKQENASEGIAGWVQSRWRKVLHSKGQNVDNLDHLEVTFLSF